MPHVAEASRFSGHQSLPLPIILPSSPPSPLVRWSTHWTLSPPALMTPRHLQPHMPLPPLLPLLLPLLPSLSLFSASSLSPPLPPPSPPPSPPLPSPSSFSPSPVPLLPASAPHSFLLGWNLFNYLLAILCLPVFLPLSGDSGEPPPKIYTHTWPHSVSPLCLASENCLYSAPVSSTFIPLTLCSLPSATPGPAPVKLAADLLVATSNKAQ